MTIGGWGQIWGRGTERLASRRWWVEEEVPGHAGAGEGGGSRGVGVPSDLIPSGHPDGSHAPF